MASINVVVITSAWLLAETSSSPLINSLLIGAQNLPAFLPLKRSLKGMNAFFLATILLELIVVFLYFDLLPNWLVIVSTLGVAQLASYGSLICLLPITGIVLKEAAITNKSLQKTSDAGSLMGTIIGGIVYPLFKLFPPAVLLALAPFWLSKYYPQAPTNQSLENTNATQSAPPIDHWCLLQGLCIGALFGLLPLWVISIKRGSALDFSIVFGAFMLGRIFTNKALPKLSGVTHYFLCAVLIFIAFLPQTPLWVDVFIFIPLGASITSIEFELIDHLKQHGELSFRRDILFRSLAIASAISSLIMGGIGQAIGVTSAMLLVSLLFSFAALVTWRWRRPTISLSTN
ncbi:hypothetical protein [Synechococcus sp. UW179A]|uniref:hypothetical protein n=1 Tax=Synechococcus sp. UW179A TaxID=2575510 RepID=UPI0010BF5ECA|nr:hypothetical protein [Synechococcus sp. UW179A]